jgi:hypothetical protein
MVLEEQQLSNHFSTIGKIDSGRFQHEVKQIIDNSMHVDS